MGAKQRILEGTIAVCRHGVSFWYDVTGHQLTQELRETLEEEARRRAKEMICEDFWASELNCDYDDEEIAGWWEIVFD